MRVALDTNVLVYLAGDPSQPVCSQTRQRLDDLVGRGHELCIAPQCLMELWCVATKPVVANGLGFSTAQAEAAVRRTLDGGFRLLSDPGDLLHTWLYLCVKHDVRGRQAFDARLVAWMVGHGIEHVLTCDASDFKRFPEITIVTEAAEA